MNKIPNIDLKQVIDFLKYIAIIIVIILIAFIVHAERYKHIKNEIDTINNIEERLTKQEHYMHQVQADIHEFKEQEVLSK